MGLLYFKTGFANTFYGITLFAILFNVMCVITGYASNGANITMVILVLVIWIIAIIAASLNDAFDGYNNDDEIEDTKKSVLFLVIILVTYLTLYQMNKPKPVIPPPNLSIKIADIVIYEKHGKKDIFSIGYIDEHGVTLFTDNYTDIEKRQGSLDRMTDEYGVINARITFKRINGTRYVEIVNNKN
jgi:hypothetical protein